MDETKKAHVAPFAPFKDARQKKEWYINNLKAEADYKLHMCEQKVQIALDEKEVIRLQLERDIFNVENNFYL